MTHRETAEVDIQALMLFAYQEGRITYQEREAIQSQLIDIFIEITAQNGWNPMELGAERTEQMIASIRYQIEACLLKEEDIEGRIQRLKDTPWIELFLEGQKELKKRLVECRQIADHFAACHMPIDHQAYLDTINKGIPEFLEKYDLDFKAKELPGNFDYPLCLEPTKQNGVLFVWQYLKNLQLEEEFLGLFEEERCLSLLRGYSTNYKNLSVNVFELVLNNVLGKILLLEPSSSSSTLTMSNKEREQLEILAKNIGHMKLTKKVEEGMRQYLSTSGEQLSVSCKEYIMESLPKFVYRYQQAVRTHTLERFFVSEQQPESIIKESYHRTKRMSLIQMKELQKELELCQYSQDKLALIRNRVSNLDDLIEILSHCVYGEEAREFFVQLSDFELAALMVKVLHDSENPDCFHEEQSANWQLELLLCIKQMDAIRQEKINQFVRKGI